jgi:hypothetical protein
MPDRNCHHTGDAEQRDHEQQLDKGKSQSVGFRKIAH